MNKPDDINIIADTGWQHVALTSRPSRGINDYMREIKFADQLNDDQLKAVCRWLECDNCPGWTGVKAQLLFGSNSTPVEYRFTCTYDSSD